MPYWQSVVAVLLSFALVAFFAQRRVLGRKVYTALAGDFYGTKHLATNYGILLLAWGFAGVLGPVIGSRVFVSRSRKSFSIC